LQKTLLLIFFFSLFIPSADDHPFKPEQNATKALRHKAKLCLIFIFASWCLGGENVLPQSASISNQAAIMATTLA
jgi:hypothetical protein